MFNEVVLAVTVVLEVGSSVVGTTGMLAEHVAKMVDKEKHPTLRKIGELFTKTIQNAAAAFALVILGSLFTNPVGVIAASVIGLAMVLTPYVNAGVEHSDKPRLKQVMNVLENVVDISAKLVNTAVLTTGVYLALGTPAAVLAGAGVGALSFMAFRKA